MQSEQLRQNDFSHVNRVFSLAVAIDLKRIWCDVLEEPLPRDLQRLIERLEAKIEKSTREPQPQS